MASDDDRVTGGCLCGAVRYAATAAARRVTYCHCAMCRKASGAPVSVFAAFAADALAFTSGRPKVYRSSSFVERGFCAACGTPLTYRYLRSDALSVTVGSLDHPERVAPESHWGIESHLPWLTIADDLPRKRPDEDPDFAAFAVAADRKDS